MSELTYEQIIETLDKISVVLNEAGFPSGSVKIGFNPEKMDEKLQTLLEQKNNESKAIIVTPMFSCHFGGCGLICCEF